MMKHPILYAVKNCRLRARFFTTDFLSERFKDAWGSRDALALDRAIMLNYVELDWWARPFMPEEILIERENMLLQNMTNEGAINIADSLKRIHEACNARLVIVMDRKKGFRLKQPFEMVHEAGSSYDYIEFSPEAWDGLARTIEKIAMP